MATFLASPVSITVFRTPAALSWRMASLLLGLTMSAITICPAYLPLMAMWMMVPTAVAGDVGNAQAIHQLIVAGRDLNAVHLCDDAVAADFLDLGDPGTVDLLAVARWSSC